MEHVFRGVPTVKQLADAFPGGSSTSGDVLVVSCPNSLISSMVSEILQTRTELLPRPTLRFKLLAC